MRICSDPRAIIQVMNPRFPISLRLAAGLVAAWVAHATIVPQISFDQLTARSELVVSGRIVRSWAAWDAENKYIWTHYEIAVAVALKGSPGRVVEFAEPGGAVGNRVTQVDGTVVYSVGESVVAFLARMPNGYLRTTGWGQGKYRLDTAGRLHATARVGSDAPDGVALNELKARIGSAR